MGTKWARKDDQARFGTEAVVAEMSADDRFPAWHSYPKILALGHAALGDLSLLDQDVTVEEKVDGSQFSFGVGFDGVLRVRSKGAEFTPDYPEKMFSAAVETVKSLAHLLHPGWAYRAEYLQKPKHNALAYNRIPERHLIIFDVNDGHESYLAPADRYAEATALGLECVPVLYSGKVSSADQLREMLGTVSVLGGQKIEGVVIKPFGYNLFGRDGKVVMAKFVSEAFKEVHAKEWRKSNPTNGDVLLEIGMRLRTEARWNKAIQHLRERGDLTGTPKDIGALMKEAVSDTEAEEVERIKDRLYSWAWPHVRREITRGLPEWYKQRLAESAFEPGEPSA